MKDAINGGLSGATENTITKVISDYAESGLLSLGYKAQDITKILNNLDYKNASSSEEGDKWHCTRLRSFNELYFFTSLID